MRAYLGGGGVVVQFINLRIAIERLKSVRSLFGRLRRFKCSRRLCKVTKNRSFILVYYLTRDLAGQTHRKKCIKYFVKWRIIVRHDLNPSTVQKV